MSIFLEETTEAILRSKHLIGDILFIGSQESGHSCTWTQFRKLADASYDSSHGAQRVASDLIIVFSDGEILKRWEYDSSEGWDCIKPFVIPTPLKPIKSLFTYRSTLEEANK